MDYRAEIERIEKEIQVRNNQRQQLEGLLTAKKSELAKVEEEIKEKFECSPEDLVSKAQEMKEELEKNISDMKSQLGLT